MTAAVGSGVGTVPLQRRAERIREAAGMGRVPDTRTPSQAGQGRSVAGGEETLCVLKPDSGIRTLWRPILPRRMPLRLVRRVGRSELWNRVRSPPTIPRAS